MEELISRKAAIKIASGYCHPSNIAAELAKLPVIPGQQWTPCSERLPKNMDDVLVTYIVNDNLKRRFIETAYYNCDERCWYSFYDEFRVAGTKIDIIAWMPFPLPYENEDRT